MEREKRGNGMKKAGILLVLSLLVAGCGISDNVREAPVEEEQEEKVVLEFYTWTDEKNYMTEAIRTFMEIYPEIQVNIHLIPSSEYAQTISILPPYERETAHSIRIWASFAIFAPVMAGPVRKGRRKEYED